MTKQELALCLLFGANYVTRHGNIFDLWENEPTMGEFGVYCDGKNLLCFMQRKPDLFGWMEKESCICVKDYVDLED